MLNAVQRDAANPGESVPTVWTAFGIDPDWISMHLDPACQALGERIARGPQPDSMSGLIDDEQDWDILFLGGEGSEADGTDLEQLVQWVAQRRPLGQIIAVTPSASLGRQLALVKAGAFDVLVLNSKDRRIEQIVEHAIELVQARRRATDQEKLKLVNQLVVSVNHEINNPLTGLMGTAELLLLENKSLTDKVRHDIKMILQQARRIQEVTARLKSLNHLRTVPYGSHDRMIDLIGATKIEEAEQRPVDAASPTQFLPEPAVLVVDDNPLIIELILRLFEQHYDIEGVTRPSDALNEVTRRTFDLVLIDLIMPEMTGLELFREIRKVRPHQKMLLTTAYQGDSRIEQAIHEGALGCIYKPFQIEELEKAFSEALKA